MDKKLSNNSEQAIYLKKEDLTIKKVKKRSPSLNDDSSNLKEHNSNIIDSHSYQGSNQDIKSKEKMNKKSQES